MPRQRGRDIEKAYGRTAFAEKLRRLADAIDVGGRFSIQVSGERVHVPAGALFNIEHERSGSDEELEFQLKWKNANRKPRRSSSK